MSERVGGRWHENTELLTGETVLDEQGARYSRGAFTARGKLFVTNERLIFCPARNFIGPKNTSFALPLNEISNIGTSGQGRFVRFFLIGRNTDSWFVDAGGERYWIDLGKGWNTMWVEKFAKRLGLAVTSDETRE